MPALEALLMPNAGYGGSGSATGGQGAAGGAAAAAASEQVLRLLQKMEVDDAGVMKVSAQVQALRMLEEADSAEVSSSALLSFVVSLNVACS
jgi:hypothetical protein